MDYNKTMKCAHVVVVASICMVGALGVGAADWNRMGPDAGNLTALAAHPSDPEIALAGTQYAGVFRTQDGGRSWVHTGLRELGITVFEFSAVDPNRVYAGLTRWPMDRSPGGVFVSDDGGLSWTAARSGLESVFCPPDSDCDFYLEINDLAVDPIDSSTVWAATDYGLFLTNDAGDSWSQVPEIGGYRVLSVTVTSDEAHTVFVSWPSFGVVKSEDGGFSWIDASVGLEHLHHTGREVLYSLDELVEAPWNPGLLFGRINSEDLFRFDPNDQTWSQVEALDALPFRGAYNQRWLSCVVPGPPGSQDLWLGTFWSGVIRSTDGGVSWAYTDSIGIDCEDNLWEPGTESFLEIPVMAVLAGSGERIVAGTTSRSIVRSLDGGSTWHPASEGLSNSYPYSLLIDEAQPGRMLVGTRGHGLFLTEDGGGAWTEALSHQVFPCDFWGPNPWSQPPPDCWTWFEIREAPQDRVMVRGECGIFVSFDRGAGWQPAGEIDHWPLGHSNNDQFWYVRDQGLVLFGDGDDANWQACGEVPAPYSNGRSVEHVVFHELEPEVALAVRRVGLFRTEDGCGSWIQTGEALTGDGLYNYWARVDPGCPGRFLVSNARGLWESIDHALTWELIGFDDNPVYDLLFDPIRENVVYATTAQDGIVYSMDRGESWGSFGLSWAAGKIGDIALDPDGSTLYAAVYGDGVYRLNLNTRFGWAQECQDSLK